MTGYEGHRVITARELAQGLRELGDARAPASLLPSVLGQVGLEDSYVTLDSPLGPLVVAYNDRGVSLVMRADSTDDVANACRARLGRPVRPAARPPTWLSRAFDRPAAGAAAGLRFDLRGLSEFERAVLLKALEIPRGEVRPYSWVAREIGRPRAVRAVGTALAHNPIPLLIPCHRVVRSDGHIGKYGLGGAEAKRTVLAAEGVAPDDLERLVRSGVRYVGSDTTHIYCFPTCRQARRIADRHRVPFGSAPDAAAAGFRPCKLCRPA